LDNGAGVPGLAVAMILVAIGVGGVKATFSPFLGTHVNQLDDTTNVSNVRKVTNMLRRSPEWC